MGFKKTIPTPEWGKKVKDYQYDTEFVKFTDLQLKKMKNLLGSDEYDVYVDEYIGYLQDSVTQWFYEVEQQSISSCKRSA